ncbi:hypothetical protein FHX42_004548 [Saccharopolyspora lacisalsi]|uniref:Uncharacterized protein n=1 Tax=Halosaccharopolyspora lacisalsi TaxID=1000566 RepID=A0A839E080_9PSEU|nr:hypothetical protein [Halosaccharopolyspora lacisalsi]
MMPGRRVGLLTLPPDDFVHVFTNSYGGIVLSDFVVETIGAEWMTASPNGGDATVARSETYSAWSVESSVRLESSVE